jgi:hypothetical protein
MTIEDQLPDHLALLGEALDRAARADLAAHSPGRRLRHPRRVAAGVGLFAVLAPAAAIAARQLLVSPSQVAASLPQGTKALIGTDPTCTVVMANVEYQCLLANAPSPGPPPQLGLGTITSAGGSGEPSALVKTPSGQEVIIGAPTDLALKDKILKLEHADGTNGNATVHTSNPPAPADTDWTGTVEPTVDATGHVNGGCRAENSAGTDWDCYIGEAAVTQKIIGQHFLGQYSAGPGVG